jgi:hypothetical protein
MDVFPLAVTQGDLQTLIRVCKDVLGESPTRGLDKSHISKTDPAAFLSVLKMDNQPLDALRHKSNIWDHFGVSFVAVVDADILIELQKETTLKVFSREGRKKYVAILSGTITEWHSACCLTSVSPELKELLTTILGYLKRVGFREVFAYDNQC